MSGAGEVQLETSRLILRRPALEDFEAWVDLMGDERSSRFIGGPMSRPEAWRSLGLMAGHWTLRGYGNFALILKSTGACIGRAGPWLPEAWPGREVGWALRVAYQGQGYAEEAARAAIDWAFEALGWEEVVHCIDPLNTPSIRLAERLGSSLLRREPLPPPYAQVICGVYGQSREAWRRRRTG
jgi:RimJ/RimL family protein N-acetyltransferase